MNDLSDFIQQVKRANDIVDVIGSYLEVKKRGSQFWARCPFHGEKTPSFSVNRNMQIFKCFGCGESGDVIKFVQKYESCTFIEAIELLAKRANLKMPETTEQKQDKEFQERKKKKDVYLAICKDTAIFYYKCFYGESGKVARDYVAERGFDADTVKKFGIGYSPNGSDLVNYLQKRNYQQEDCLKCGVLQRANSGRLYDPLHHRLIVPIFNMQGKVIAFGGRGLTTEIIENGKYKNTSDSPQFSKRDTLFALNIAKEQKQQSELDNLVVVEGYMDVIAMYQAGFRRVVASMGTSLTESQAKWMSRLTKSVYICYDGDGAGQKATVKGMDLLDKAGLDVKVMSVPEKKDPDEYIKAYGKQAFEQLIDKALPLPDYKLQLLRNAFPIDSEDSAKRNDAMQKFVKGCISLLLQLDDVKRERYVREISTITGYSQEYFARKLLQSQTQQEQQSLPESTSSPEMTAKYFVLASMLTNQPYATLKSKPLCQTEFLSAMFDYVFDCLQKGDKPSLDMMYTICPDASEQEYEQIISVNLQEERKQQNATFFTQCVRLLQVEQLQIDKQKLLEQVKKNPQDTTLLTQLASLSQKINTLN